jgi:hypothetical protein
VQIPAGFQAQQMHSSRQLWMVRWCRISPVSENRPDLAVRAAADLLIARDADFITASLWPQAVDKFSPPEPGKQLSREFVCANSDMIYAALPFRSSALPHRIQPPRRRQQDRQTL